ncbi:MAG: NUDIX domain-containing protein [Microthrixaceae bacterium]|nr:NUDIX domain-containing protein [Microthrixaceae bacterium]
MDDLHLVPSGDARLTPTRDPQRSRRRLMEAELDGGSQLAIRDRVVGLLEEHGESLADRTTAAAHLTGSALVLDAAGRRCLVMLHTKLNRWLQPGGHADGDHELAGVALKEASEETGIGGCGFGCRRWTSTSTQWITVITSASTSTSTFGSWSWRHPARWRGPITNRRSSAG